MMGAVRRASGAVRRARRTAVSGAAACAMAMAAAGAASAAGSWGPALRGQVEPPAGEEARQLGFWGGVRFDPAAGVPAADGDPDAAEPAAGESGYYVVQGHAPLAAEFPAILSSLGATPLRYQTFSAWIVRADRQAAGRLRAHDAVRWIGPYRPSWRMSPELRAATGPRERIVVSLFPGADVAAAAAGIARSGGTVRESVESEWNRLVYAEVNAAALPALAAWPGVDYLERDYPMELDNDRDQWVIQTNVSGNRRVFDMGIDGTGQIVTLHDSGLHMAHCMFNDPGVPVAADGDYPTHRKVIAYKSVAGGQFGDAGGHGSHTGNTVGGSDLAAEVKDGMAPGARLYFTDGETAGGVGIFIPGDLNTLFNMSFLGNGAGAARVSTNSWGGSAPGDYTTRSLNVDQFMWNHQDYLICFSNGNDGPAAGTVHAPATAKNCISGGGTGNGALSGSIYASTSRGPAEDGRQKPTVCAPATLSSAATGTACSYVTFSGTSMSTPTLAGGATLIRQYLMDGWYPTGAPVGGDALTPSAALLKAMAVNSGSFAVGPAAAPDNNIGWGRMLLDDVLYFAGDARRLLLYDEAGGLSTGAFDEYQVYVYDSGVPLEVSLVWTDYPGNPALLVQLVNNLDLRVTHGADVYLGNVYSGGQSVTGGAADDRDVEEGVQRNIPETGLWTIRVTGTSCPQGPQPYALVVTGAVTDQATSVAGTPPAAAADRLELTHGPSPVRTGAEIRYRLPASGEVRLTLFDVTGRVVRTLLEEPQEASEHRVAWDTRDAAGREVPNGVYFYRLETPGGARTEKLVVSR